jgi:hypothetical protein
MGAAAAKQFDCERGQKRGAGGEKKSFEFWREKRAAKARDQSKNAPHHTHKHKHKHHPPPSHPPP